MKDIKDLIREYAEIVEPNYVQDEYLRQYYCYKYADKTEQTRMVSGMLDVVTNNSQESKMETIAKIRSRIESAKRRYILAHKVWVKIGRSDALKIAAALDWKIQVNHGSGMSIDALYIHTHTEIQE